MGVFTGHNLEPWRSEGQRMKGVPNKLGTKKKKKKVLELGSYSARQKTQGGEKSGTGGSLQRNKSGKQKVGFGVESERKTSDRERYKAAGAGEKGQGAVSHLGNNRHLGECGEKQRERGGEPIGG